MLNISESAQVIQGFVSNSLTDRISEIEDALQDKRRNEVVNYLEKEVINSQIIQSAFSLKNIISQIYVVIHSAGILLTLPKILKEDEVIEYLSLGAGNTGKEFDLETSYRIAEFKFINWKGGAESIRQNSLFKDFFLLAESQITKQKELYVIDREIPLRFLNGNRAIESVFSRNNKLLLEFRSKYEGRFSTVREYYDFKKDEVHLISLFDIIPEIKDFTNIEPDESI